MTVAETKRRRGELAKIHIGAKQLGGDKEAYRDMLEAVTGKRSAGDLDAAGRRKVIEHLESCGAKFERPRREARRPRPAPEIRELLKKVDALLINHPEGRKPRSYAEGILQHMASSPHRTPLEWAKSAQLVKVVQALEVDKRRRQRRATREEAA